MREATHVHVTDEALFNLSSSNIRFLDPKHLLNYGNLKLLYLTSSSFLSYWAKYQLMLQTFWFGTAHRI